MKLSKETLEILHNCQEINNSIVINPGNLIKTTHPDSLKILLQAQIVEELPYEISIFELSSLNSLLKMFPDADINFQERFLDINTSSSGSIRYMYSEKSALESYAAVYIGDKRVFPKDLKFGVENEDLKFELPYSDLKTAMKVSHIIGLSSIMFETDDNGMLYMKVVNPRNDTSNSYTKNICKCNKKIKISVNTDNLKLLQRDYIISILKNKLIFKSVDEKLLYVVASEV